MAIEPIDQSRLTTWVEDVHRETTAKFIADGSQLRPCPVMIVRALDYPGWPGPATLMVPLGDLDPDKHTAFQVAKVLAAAIEVDAYCLTTDAWMVDLKPGEFKKWQTNNEPVRNHPRRVEALVTVGESQQGDRPTGFTTKYQRGHGGAAYGFEPMDRGNDESRWKPLAVAGILDPLWRTLMPGLVRESARVLALHHCRHFELKAGAGNVH